MYFVLNLIISYAFPGRVSPGCSLFGALTKDSASLRVRAIMIKLRLLRTTVGE